MGRISDPGRRRSKFNYDKKIDLRKQWELEKRDEQHERMVREFFKNRAKKSKKDNDRR